MRRWTDDLRVPVLQVQYENLVQSPRDVIERILTTSSLPFDESCMQHEQSAAAVTDTAVASPIHTRSAGKWRDYTNEAVLQPLFAYANAHNEL